MPPILPYYIINDNGSRLDTVQLNFDNEIEIVKKWFVKFLGLFKKKVLV